MSNVKFEIYTKAMALFTGAAKATVTPTQLSAALGKDVPASKHAWFLKSLGFTLTANKDGRNVVSYTMDAAPKSAPAQKVKAAKSAPAKKKATAPKKVAKTTVTTTAPAPAAAKKTKKKSPTARKANATAAAPEPALTDAELMALSNDETIEDVGELDTGADLPAFLR